MLDRLQARETIELANALSYGAGHMDPKQSSRYVDFLHERAYPQADSTPNAVRAKSVQEMQHLMMGDGYAGMRMVLEKGPREAEREAAEQAARVKETVEREETHA